VYSILYLEDNYSIENFVVKKMDNWLKGVEKMPRYEKMNTYIKKHQSLIELTTLLNTKEIDDNLRNRCNDDTYYNFFYKSASLNCSDIYIRNREKHLDVFMYDIEQLFVFHLSNLLYLNENYMMSTDYVDYLDVGMKPEENSQYWVSPLIQEAFDKYIKLKHPVIADKIIEHTCMDLK